VASKVPDEIRWYRDERTGERYMACPHAGCPGYLMPGVGGGGICVVCNRERQIPDPPPEACPECGKALRPRLDAEPGLVCPRCGSLPGEWEERWGGLRNGERAVVQLVMALARLGAFEMPVPEVELSAKEEKQGLRRDKLRCQVIPSDLGPLIERLELGDIQSNVRVESVSHAHLIVGDLAPPFGSLAEEDRIHLILSVPDILGQLDKEPGRTRYGAPLDIARELSECRLQKFCRDHRDIRDGPTQAIIRYGLDCKGGHLSRRGYCVSCGQWFEAERRGRSHYHMRARCFCRKGGTRIHWGIQVRWDKLGQLYNGSLRRWERALREARDGD